MTLYVETSYLSRNFFLYWLQSQTESTQLQGGGKMRMCGCSNVSNADVDAGKDPHFTHTSVMLHSRY